MSWQAYVDNHLMCEIEGNYLTFAAIVGLDGSVWAQSQFPEELQKEQVEAVRKEAESQVMMKRLKERIRALEEKSIGNVARDDP
ncbi:hypothetical protein QQ045_005385 [Rhodiola kirilowii]